MTEDAKATRESILVTVDDLAANFLYYDRKEDDDPPVGAIEAAVERGEITWDDMVGRFRAALCGLGASGDVAVAT